MRFALLGPLEVTDDAGTPLDVGGRQPRLVLAALLAAGGRPVPVDALLELLWGDAPPKSATGTLQTYVSRLRRALDERAGPALVFDAAGYRIDTTGHEVDLRAFDQLAAAGAEHLAAGRPEEAGDALASALALWRGEALAELVEQGSGLAQAATLEDRRLAVLEQRLDADLALGRHAQVVGELAALAEAHPLREGLHAKLALALYRSGRQADALRALAAATAHLREELGLEPTPALVALEAAILAHDPSLDVGAAVPPGGSAAAPAPVPSAGRRASGPVDAPAGGIPLVGRDAELAELTAALAEAPEDARFVVVEGDPGIGKTRLVEELAVLAARAGSLVAWGRSNETGAAPALWPWLPILRSTVPSAVDEVPAPLVDVLGGESPLLVGQGPALQFERFDAVADVLERAGKEAAAVVLLDDLQWADTTSLELLQFLATRLTRGVLVVATVRTLEVGHAGPVTDALAALARRHGSRRLRLRGLGAGATGELLAAVGSAPVPAELAARIHERAEGNPFYAIELARLADAGDEGEVPAGVRDAVRRRFGGLPEETVELLRVAAVVGRDVDLGLVAAAAGVPLADCLDRLDPAAALRLLDASTATPGGLRFAHALVREVLLDDLTSLRRARIHLAVADALAAAAGGDHAVDRDDAEVLAEHLWRAVPLGVGERAAAALERAAETATSRVAYHQAEELLERARQLRRAAGSSPAAKRAELATLLRLLEVTQATRYFAGTDREVLHRAQQLAAELDDEDVVRTMAWSEWAALSTSGNLVECRPMAEAHLARWGEDPRPQVRASAHVLMGVDEWTRGRIDVATGHLDTALALLAEAPPPANAFEAEYTVIAHAFAAYSHAARGDITLAEALGTFEFLLGIVPPEAAPAVCSFASATAAAHRSWADVERFASRALDADPAAQFAFFGAQLLMQRSLVLAAAGDLDGGLAMFLEGRSRYRAVNGKSTTDTYQAMHAELLAEAGRVAEAKELLGGARRQLDEGGGEGPDELPILVAEGVVAFHDGDRERAVERLALAVEVGERTGARHFAEQARRAAAARSLSLPG